MSNDDKQRADAQGKSLARALLNSMWGFWLVLLAISFGVAGSIYLIWLKGNV